MRMLFIQRAFSSAARLARTPLESQGNTIAALLRKIDSTASRAPGTVSPAAGLPAHLREKVSFGDRFKLQRLPRTGVLVGRSVPVLNGEHLGAAIRKLNMLNRVNQVYQTARLQQFHERPGKKKLRIRIKRKKQEFNAGIRRLFELVNQARKLGY